MTRGVDVWAELASGYDAWFETPAGAFVIGEQVAALRRILPREAGASVVEIGAGTGYIAGVLQGEGFRVTAVEPSDAMRAEGMRRAEGTEMEWYAAMAEDLPFEDGAFDGALFFTSLEFIERLGRALVEARRVVRQGGWIVAAILDSRSAWVELYRAEAAKGNAPWTAATFFEPSEVETLMGLPAEAVDGAVYFAPGAEPPFEDADARPPPAPATPSLSLLRWRNA
jgi:ubiquinone/menaquinone biosynthesis C-methylase UbiE